jgi:hypothetical protein
MFPRGASKTVTSVILALCGWERNGTGEPVGRDQAPCPSQHS